MFIGLANEVAARLPEELISKPRPKKVRKMKAVNPLIIKDVKPEVHQLTGSANIEQQEQELTKCKILNEIIIDFKIQH